MQQIKFSPIRYFLGKPLQFLGRVIWVISGITSIFLVPMIIKGLFNNLIRKEIYFFIYILIFAIIFFFFGKFIFGIGKKFAAYRADYVLSKDERKPVLYLRSFLDDKSLDRYVKETFDGDAFSSLDKFLQFSTFRLPFVKFSSRTLEEEIADGLHWVGPCIAAGIPGERLPSGLGMARFYMEEYGWENEIKNLMLKAELVLMRAATTKSFTKELEMAVEFVNPRKLLIILPSGFNTIQSNKKNFIEIAKEILPKELPKLSVDENSKSEFQGFLWFYEDWTPEFSYRMLTQSTFEAFAKRYMNSEERYFLQDFVF